MATIFRILLMLISTIGTWEWIHRKIKVNVYFLPSLTIAVQVTFLIAAGILNFLFETAIVLFVFGIISFFYFLIKIETRNFLFDYLKTGFVFLLLASLVLLIAVRGKHFGHIDNFTHWATVVKVMLRNNRFPNFSDEVIGFPTYPLGSSSYIYYFSRMVGISESIQMFAQIYMMLTCILPLFIFCKKNKIAVFLLICAFTNFIFVYNITITNLLVDTLLPLAAMCGFLFIYIYGKQVDPKETFYACAFYMVWVMQIKNSGLFFLLLMIGTIFFVRKDNKKIFPRILCACAPFLSFLLWKRHYGLVFINPENSKHAMTLENYLQIFHGKSQTDIQLIVDHLTEFLLTWKDIRLIVLLILIGILITYITKSEWKLYIKAVLIAFFMFVFYQLGLLCMYIFSMHGEGLYHSATMRYDKTVIIAIIYLLMAVTIKAISATKINKFAGSISSLLLILFFFGFMKVSLGEIRIAGKHYDYSPYYLYKRMWVEKHKSDFVMESDDTFCVLVSNQSDGNYLQYSIRYALYTGNTRYAIITDQNMMDEVTEEFIFIYDDNNEIINKWVQTNYPEQAGNQVVRRWDLYESN